MNVSKFHVNKTKIKNKQKTDKEKKAINTVYLCIH